LPLISEMKGHFGWNYKLNNGKVDKSSIAPSGSAFESDVTHIKSFGVSLESPFSIPKPTTKASPFSKTENYPKLMKADGYTRSGRSNVLPNERANIPIPNNNENEKPDNHTIVGPKQETGSIKNNHAYKELKEKEPSIRFTTETMDR
jgi:hypothetical protein